MDFIAHSGKGHDDNPPGRGSGRYPYGSGARPFQDLSSKQIKRLHKKAIRDYKNGNQFKSNSIKKVTNELKEQYNTSQKILDSLENFKKVDYLREKYTPEIADRCIKKSAELDMQKWDSSDDIVSKEEVESRYRYEGDYIASNKYQPYNIYLNQSFNTKEEFDNYINNVKNAENKYEQELQSLVDSIVSDFGDTKIYNRTYRQQIKQYADFYIDKIDNEYNYLTTGKNDSLNTDGIPVSIFDSGLQWLPELHKY